MNCRQVNPLLTTYIDGEAAADEKQKIETHLQHCEHCRRELRRLVQLQAVLRSGLPQLAAEVWPTSQASTVFRVGKVEQENAMITRQNHMSPLNGRRILAWSPLVIALLVLGLVGFVPQVRAQAQEFLNRIVLGPYSEAVQENPPAQTPRRPLPADTWVIRTEIGGFGGNAAPGQNPRVQSFASVEEARSASATPILQPSVLPEGYKLQAVKLAPFGAGQWVILIYIGPGHDIVVAQMPGGPQPAADPNTLSSSKTGLLTSGSLEQVQFNGHPAAWIDGHILMWAEGVVSYEVGGLDLTWEQVETIARSLQ
jgi:hypothetical protein